MTTKVKKRRRLSEASAERMIDRAIQARLESDPAYVNASCAESQAEAEAIITRQETDRVYGTYEVD